MFYNFISGVCFGLFLNVLFQIKTYQVHQLLSGVSEVMCSVYQANDQVNQ